MSGSTLFPLPPIAPKGLRQAISNPHSEKVLAMCRLVHVASIALRGDGKAAGHAVIVDSLPAFSSLGIAHEARTAYAALSGLTHSGDIEELRGEILDGIPVPSHAEVWEEVERIKEPFAAALVAAANAVRNLEVLKFDE